MKFLRTERLDNYIEILYNGDFDEDEFSNHLTKQDINGVELDSIMEPTLTEFGNYVGKIIMRIL